jgi:DNA mismatch repair ATPase MutL
VQCTVQQQSTISNQQSTTNNQQPAITTNNQQQKQQQQQQEQEQEQNQQTNNETNHKTNNKTHKNNTTDKTREASKSQTSTIIVNTVEAGQKKVSPETYRCTSPPWRLIRLPNWEFGTINREPLASNYCCRAQEIHQNVHFWKEKKKKKCIPLGDIVPCCLHFRGVMVKTGYEFILVIPPSDIPLSILTPIDGFGVVNINMFYTWNT